MSRIFGTIYVDRKSGFQEIFQYISKHLSGVYVASTNLYRHTKHNRVFTQTVNDFLPIPRKKPDRLSMTFAVQSKLRISLCPTYAQFDSPAEGSSHW